MTTGRGGLFAAGLVLALALAACGGSHRAPQHVAKRPVATSPAPQLVSMRRIDGATWETVVVRSDGTGDVGVFIGEWSGTHHHQFQLGSRELGQLRHFVAVAGEIRDTPAFGSTPSVEYMIFARQRFLETAQGHVPHQLDGLLGVLNGLIARYE